MQIIKIEMRYLIIFLTMTFTFESTGVNYTYPAAKKQYALRPIAGAISKAKDMRGRDKFSTDKSTVVRRRSIGLEAIRRYRGGKGGLRGVRLKGISAMDDWLNIQEFPYDPAKTPSKWLEGDYEIQQSSHAGIFWGLLDSIKS